MAPHFSILAWKIPWMEELVGCSPWGRQEWDMTEWLPFHFSLSCIGEGNGNPLQCSCLENPRDGGAWWAAVCGVTQSWTRMKWLSSSSSSNSHKDKHVNVLDNVYTCVHVVCERKKRKSWYLYIFMCSDMHIFAKWIKVK